VAENRAGVHGTAEVRAFVSTKFHPEMSRFTQAKNPATRAGKAIFPG
jgi:hypothetical protein